MPDSLTPELVKRRITAFRRRFGKAHYYFAEHAAFPLALTPDLLNHLWINFQRDTQNRVLKIPWVSIADLLLSNLCRQVGSELYEMHELTRHSLLDDLRADTRFGPTRLTELALFLQDYIEQGLQSASDYVRNLAETQHYAALAYIEPRQAAAALATAAVASIEAGNLGEQLRFASIADVLADPLRPYQLLIDYLRDRRALIRGVQPVSFLTQPSAAVSALVVAGVTLPPLPANISLPNLTAQMATLLRDAQLALDEQDWSTAIAKAQSLLALAPGDADAASILDRARHAQEQAVVIGIDHSSSEKLQAASLRLRAPANQGTGYLVAPTTIATCHHVVESAGEGGSVDVVLPDRVVQARVLKAVRHTDCALLELDAPLAGREPLPLAGRCDQGAQWDGYGFPHPDASSGLPFFGMVLEPESLDDLGRPMVTLYSDMLAAGMTAPVHGLSGGPVVVGGAVVGHFSRVLGTPGAAGQPALEVVYAARAANVLALLGTPPAVAEAPAPRPAALADLIPRLGPGEFHAFISYCSSDRPFALRLYERLDGVGLRVFLDQREPVIGEALGGLMHGALAKSRCGIVLVSRGWVESPWCLEEGNAMISRAINERGAFRVIPVLLDTSEMPPMFAGRLWLDFAGENVPSGRKLEQLIYAVLGRPSPPEGSVDAKVQITLTDATDEALRRVDDMLRDPTRYRRLVDFLGRTELPEVAVKLRAADALIGAGRLEAALDILPPAEQSLRTRQLRALALFRGARHEEARALLEPMFANQEVDAETGGILGGIYRRLWQATGDRGYLIKALDTYRITYAATGDEYVGINVAAMALLLDKRAEGQRIAAMILETLGGRPESTLHHWHLATVAEAYLIRGDVEQAAAWYEKAVAGGLTLPMDIAVMRRQARLLLEKLGHDPNALDGSLPVPPVVAFVGHMTDAPGRAVPRFPASTVEAVRRAVAAWLRRHGGRVHAVCSAARGADLVFLEEMLAREGTATVILPFPPAEFKQVSVGTGWDERFDTTLANDRVEVRPPLQQTLPPALEQAEAFERCDIAILDEAERLAQLFDDTDPLLLTVWNGSPSDGSGGTAHVVSTWLQRGYRTENIDLSQL